MEPPDAFWADAEALVQTVCSKAIEKLAEANRDSPVFTTTVNWMFADLFDQPLSYHNPGRWSGNKNLDDAYKEMQLRNERDLARPIIVREGGRERTYTSITACLDEFAPLVGKGPLGLYRLVCDAVVKTSAAWESADLCILEAGTTVDVLEVTDSPVDQRVRARIAEPAGWISLLNVANGVRFAEPVDAQEIAARAASESGQPCLAARSKSQACQRHGCGRRSALRGWCTKACQTASKANVSGFHESPSYRWAFADTNFLAWYNPLRYSDYTTRWKLAANLDPQEGDETVKTPQAQARPIRIQAMRGSELNFKSCFHAREALKAHANLPANNNGFDESPRHQWRFIFPEGSFANFGPKVGKMAWSEYMSRSDMLNELREERYSSDDKGIKIRVIGKDVKDLPYRTVAEARLALEAPLSHAPDDCINSLLLDFPYMDRCGMSRILAKNDGNIRKARTEFFTRPALEPCPTANFAESSFLKEYLDAEAPASKEELEQHVHDLVGLLHFCNCAGGQDLCRERFIRQLKTSINFPSEDNVNILAQRLWTSYVQNCAGREICSMINEATRMSADPRCAIPVARLARAINVELLVDKEKIRAVPELPERPGFQGRCWRGGGFPDCHKQFFDLNWELGEKIRFPNYFATAFKDGKTVRHFLDEAQRKKLPCVKWEIELYTKKDWTELGPRRMCFCTHVNFINYSVLPDENEFLFVPYSVFEILDIFWSPDPTPDNPHRIRLRAAKDNKTEDVDLPIAPWS